MILKVWQVTTTVGDDFAGDSWLRQVLLIVTIDSWLRQVVLMVAVDSWPLQVVFFCYSLQLTKTLILTIDSWLRQLALLLIFDNWQRQLALILTCDNWLYTTAGVASFSCELTTTVCDNFTADYDSHMIVLLTQASITCPVNIFCIHYTKKIEGISFCFYILILTSTQ